VRPSGLERRLVVGVLVLCLVPAVVAGGVLLLLRREGLLETPAALFTAVLLGVPALMIYLALSVWTIGRSLVRTVHDIQIGTELMSGVNPSHRLAVETGDELQAVASQINRLADGLAAARHGLELEVARATHALTLERNTLSGVLAALGEGVVVLTADGRVSLANHAAQALLARGGATLLGRSLLDVVDGEKIAHFRDRCRRAPGVRERFSLQPVPGVVVEAVMTTLHDEERRLIGFVLVLRDVTRPARSDDERRQRLAEDIMELRSRLAAVRSLSESLAAEARGRESPDRRLLEAIHAESLRLSELVAGMSAPGRLGLAQAPGHYEVLALADLAGMALRRLGRGGEALSLTVADDAAPLLVRAEASALSAALAQLVRAALARRAPGGQAWLRAVRRGGILQLDIGADGEAQVADLEAALDLPVEIGGILGPGARETVRQHAGEVWAYAEPERAGFRLTLPGADLGESAAGERIGARPGAGFLGAGLASGSGDRVDLGERPDFYDLSLFEAMARQLDPTDRARRLADLTCVVFDTETTGLDPGGGDRIVSIAGVVVRDGVVRRGETFDALVNPGRPIPGASTRFHGITDATVAECPPIGVVLPAFLRFAADTILVGHEVWFDLRFLRTEAERLGLGPEVQARPALDTLALARVVYGPLAEPGLETLAVRLGVTVRGRHSALGDAFTTAEVLVRLVPLLASRGVRTVGQALDAVRRPRGVRRGGTPA
jgi:DNA polymerase-3 subunit epsilon